MPAYSFKINMELGNGTQLSYYNSTFANSSGSVYIEAPQIVTWINNMPLANEYIESEDFDKVRNQLVDCPSNLGLFHLATQDLSSLFYQFRL